MIATAMDTTTMSGRDVRMASRTGEFAQPTSGAAPDIVQTNLAILPKDLAFEFLVFCQRNPKPCPVIEVLEAGQTEAVSYQHQILISAAMFQCTVYIATANSLTNRTTSSEHWRDDLVTFLLGCSFTFEHALIRNGVHLPYYGTDKNVAMYKTSIQTASAGPFGGPMVVTHRWVPRNKVVRAVQATSRFPAVHGAPIHIGDPSEIGIHDLSKPDFGDAWEPQSDDDVSMFWACGVTPQAVAMASKPELMITHAPGYMFVTDMHDEDLAVM